MKTLSLILLSVVIYVAVSVEPIVPVAGGSRNADQNLEDAETISTIKDELATSTVGHSKPWSTTIGFRILSLNRDHQIANRRPLKKVRHRSKCHQDQSKAGECKKLNEECKQKEDCCGYKPTQGNIRNICKRGEDNKDTCQKCKINGDDCNNDSDCCEFPIQLAPNKFEYISLVCRVPEYSNQKKCCVYVPQFCNNNETCCNGYCDTNDRYPWQCKLGPDQCKKVGEECNSKAECCKGPNIDCLGFKPMRCTDNNKPDNDTVVDDGDSDELTRVKVFV